MEEEKQLDFSQPILSVRRVLPSSPVVVRDRKGKKPAAANVAKLPQSFPVRVSGTVPFVWEKSPGRPKNESISEPNSPLVPKLPPGRKAFLTAKFHIASECAAASEGSSSPPPHTRNSIFGRNSHAVEKFGEAVDEITTDEEEVSFVDARDSLSRTESSLLNCSVSGVSELDGLDMKPNRTLSCDLRAREFMIGRFLPAAEAMTCETPSPRYPTKKQPVLREQARQIKTIESSEMKPPSNLGNILAYNGDNVVVEEQKDEDDVDDGDDSSEPDASSRKLCRFLPSLCSNNSSRHRKQDQVPASSVRSRRVESSQASGYDSKPRMTRIRCQRKNAGGTSPVCAPKEQVFLGIPAKYRELETMGSILSVKEDISSFGELLLANEDDDDDDKEWDSGSSTPVMEKTLYMDPVHEKETSHDNQSSFQDVKQSNPPGEKEEEEEEEMEKFRSFGPCYLSFSDDEAQVEMVDDRRKNDFQNQHSIRSGQLKHSHGNSIHPLSLPLPKSPSESWLEKALPTVSPRTQLPKPHHGVVVLSKARGPNPNTSSDVVWGTIVKASGGKNMHFQFSEGKLKAIPEA